MSHKTLQKEALCSLMDKLVHGFEFASPVEATMGLLVSLGVTGRLHLDC
jgi:hypothetical protein